MFLTILLSLSLSIAFVIGLFYLETKMHVISYQTQKRMTDSEFTKKDLQRVIDTNKDIADKFFIAILVLLFLATIFAALMHYYG